MRLYHFILGGVVLNKREKFYYIRQVILPGKQPNHIKKKVKVAASIPPVFGSYKPDVFDSIKSLPILELFKNNLVQYCDLILAETLSCIDEIETVQKVFRDCKIPFWMSLTIEDEYKNYPCLRSGEELITALGKIDFNKISSVLFNCSQPEFMAKAVRVAKDVIPKKILILVFMQMRFNQ